MLTWALYESTKKVQITVEDKDLISLGSYKCMVLSFPPSQITESSARMQSCPEGTLPLLLLDTPSISPLIILFCFS